MIRKYQTILKIIIILVSVMILLKFCLIFLWPFFISILLVFLLEPLVKLMSRFGFKRKAGAILSFITGILFILIIGAFLSKYVYNQLLVFFQKLPVILSILGGKFDFLSNQKDNYTHLISTFEGIIISYRTKIFDTIVSTFNGFVYIIIIFMSTIFISMDFDKLVDFAKKNFPRDIFELIGKISVRISMIIKVEIQLIMLTTLQTIVCLYILGVNSALTIGIICGILDLLPILGPAMIFIPWIIYEFVMKDMFIAFGLIFIYILLQILREIMKIKFVGQSFQIHPVFTIVALYSGVVIYGLWGVLLGPVIVILALELFNEFNEGRKLYKL